MDSRDWISATGFVCSWYLQTLSGDISISIRSVHQPINLVMAVVDQRGIAFAPRTCLSRVTCQMPRLTPDELSTDLAFAMSFRIA